MPNKNITALANNLNKVAEISRSYGYKAPVITPEGLEKRLSTPEGLSAMHQYLDKEGWNVGDINEFSFSVGKYKPEFYADDKTPAKESDPFSPDNTTTFDFFDKLSNDQSNIARKAAEFNIDIKFDKILDKFLPVNTDEKSIKKFAEIESGVKLDSRIRDLKIGAKEVAENPIRNIFVKGAYDGVMQNMSLTFGNWMPMDSITDPQREDIDLLYQNNLISKDDRQKYNDNIGYVETWKPLVASAVQSTMFMAEAIGTGSLTGISSGAIKMIGAKTFGNMAATYGKKLLMGGANSLITQSIGTTYNTSEEISQDENKSAPHIFGTILKNVTMSVMEGLSEELLPGISGNLSLKTIFKNKGLKSALWEGTKKFTELTLFETGTEQITDMTQDFFENTRTSLFSLTKLDDDRNATISRLISEGYDEQTAKSVAQKEYDQNKKQIGMNAFNELVTGVFLGSTVSPAIAANSKRNLIKQYGQATYDSMKEFYDKNTERADNAVISAYQAKVDNLTRSDKRMVAGIYSALVNNVELNEEQQKNYDSEVEYAQKSVAILNPIDLELIKLKVSGKEEYFTRNEDKKGTFLGMNWKDIHTLTSKIQTESTESLKSLENFNDYTKILNKKGVTYVENFLFEMAVSPIEISKVIGKKTLTELNKMPITDIRAAIGQAVVKSSTEVIRSNVNIKVGDNTSKSSILLESFKVANVKMPENKREKEYVPSHNEKIMYHTYLTTKNEELKARIEKVLDNIGFVLPKKVEPIITKTNKKTEERVVKKEETAPSAKKAAVTISEKQIEAGNVIKEKAPEMRIDAITEEEENDIFAQYDKNAELHKTNIDETSPEEVPNATQKEGETLLDSEIKAVPDKQPSSLSKEVKVKKVKVTKSVAEQTAATVATENVATLEKEKKASPAPHLYDNDIKKQSKLSKKERVQLDEQANKEESSDPKDVFSLPSFENSKGEKVTLKPGPANIEDLLDFIPNFFFKDLMLKDKSVKINFVSIKSGQASKQTLEAFTKLSNEEGIPPIAIYGNGNIHINLDNLKSDLLTVALTHEYIHSLTVPGLNSSVQFRDEVMAYIDELSEVVIKDDRTTVEISTRNAYHLNSPEEFIAGIFSGSGLLDEIIKKYDNKNLWSRIKNSIVRGGRFGKRLETSITKYLNVLPKGQFDAYYAMADFEQKPNILEMRRDPISYTKDQEKALNSFVEFVDSDESIMILKGYAGTGKTTIIENLIKYHQEAGSGSSVIVSPTNTAAKVVSNKINLPAQTIHSFLYTPEETPEGGVRFNVKGKSENPIGLVIVDESSMVTPKLFNDLQALTEFGTKIVFVGDHRQLLPVMSAEDNQIENKTFILQDKTNFRTETLKEVKRTAGENLKFVTVLANENDYLEQNGYQPQLLLPNESNEKFGIFKSGFIKGFIDKIKENDSTIGLTYTNAARLFSNIHIFAGLNNLPSPEMINPITDNQDALLQQYEEFFDQDNLDPLNNDKTLLSFINNDGQFTNGENLSVKDLTNLILEEKTKVEYRSGKDIKSFTAFVYSHNTNGSKEYFLFVPGVASASFYSSNLVSNRKFMSESLNQYFTKKDKNGVSRPSAVPIATLGWVTTTHKAQGSERDNVIIFLPNQLRPTDINWLYTSLTRSKNYIGFYSPVQQGTPTSWKDINDTFNSYSPETKQEEKPTEEIPAEQKKIPKTESTKSVANIPQNIVSGTESFGMKQEATPEIKKILGNSPHSIDMIEAGLRTRTTRSVGEMEKYNIKVGDVVTHFGKAANGTTKQILTRVTAIYPKGTPGFLGTWNKEGWTQEGVKAIERFKDGAAAIEFELISSSPTQKKKAPFTVQPTQSIDKKAIVKASIATQFIGFGEGIANSSTELYRKQAGKYANTGNYSPNDTIFVSIGGKRGNEQVRKQQQDRTIKEALKAIEMGATLITDNKSYIENSDYNEGEKRLYKNLEAKGYTYSERTVDGQVLGFWNNDLINKEKKTVPTSQTELVEESSITSEDHKVVEESVDEKQMTEYSESIENDLNDTKILDGFTEQTALDFTGTRNVLLNITEALGIKLDNNLFHKQLKNIFSTATESIIKKIIEKDPKFLKVYNNLAEQFTMYKKKGYLASNLKMDDFIRNRIIAAKNLTNSREYKKFINISVVDGYVMGIDTGLGDQFKDDKGKLRSSATPVNQIDLVFPEIMEALGLTAEDIEINYINGFINRGRLGDFQSSGITIANLAENLYNDGYIHLNAFAEKSTTPVIKLKSDLAKLKVANFIKANSKFVDLKSLQQAGYDRNLGPQATIIFRSILEMRKLGHSLENILALTDDVKRDLGANFVELMKRAYLVSDLYKMEETEEHIRELGLSEDPQNESGFWVEHSVVNGKKTARVMMRVAFVDEKTFGPNGQGINKYGLPISDGASFYIMGRFDRIYRHLTGTLKPGVIKSWGSGLYEFARSIYIKDAKHGISPLKIEVKVDNKIITKYADELAEFMAKNKVGLVMSSSTEKNKVLDLKESAGYNNDINVLGNGQAITFNIPISDFQRIKETGSVDTGVKGFAQFFNTKGLGIHNTAIEDSENFMTKIIDGLMRYSDGFQKKQIKNPNEIQKISKYLKNIGLNAKQGAGRLLNKVISESIKEAEKTGDYSKVEQVVRMPFVSKFIHDYYNHKVIDSFKYKVKGTMLTLTPDLGNLAKSRHFAIERAVTDMLLRKKDWDTMNNTEKAVVAEIFGSYANAKLFKRKNDVDNLAKVYESQIQKEADQYGFQLSEKDIEERRIRLTELNQKSEEYQKEIDDRNLTYDTSGEKLRAYRESELKKYVDENGMLKPGYALFPKNAAKALGLKAGDRVLVSVTPLDSPMGATSVQIIGLTKDNEVAPGAIVLNSEFIQGIGKDFDIDTVSIMAYDDSMFTPEEWENVCDITEKINGSYIDKMYNTMKTVLKWMPEGLTREEKMKFISDKRNGVKVGTKYCQALLGDTGVGNFDIPMRSATALDLGDMYKKTVGGISNTQSYTSIINAIGLTSSSLKINPMSVFEREHILHLFMLNHAVDFPKDSSQLMYNGDMDTVLARAYKEDPSDWDVINIKSINDFLFKDINWVQKEKTDSGSLKTVEETIGYIKRAQEIIGYLANLPTSKNNLIQRYSEEIDLALNDSPDALSLAIKMKDYAQSFFDTLKVEDIFLHPGIAMIDNFDVNALEEKLPSIDANDMNVGNTGGIHESLKAIDFMLSGQAGNIPQTAYARILERVKKYRATGASNIRSLHEAYKDFFTWYDFSYLGKRIEQSQRNSVRRIREMSYELLIPTIEETGKKLEKPGYYDASIGEAYKKIVKSMRENIVYDFTEFEYSQGKKVPISQLSQIALEGTNIFIKLNRTNVKGLTFEVNAAGKEYNYNSMAELLDSNFGDYLIGEKSLFTGALGLQNRRAFSRFVDLNSPTNYPIDKRIINVKENFTELFREGAIDKSDLNLLLTSLLLPSNMEMGYDVKGVWRMIVNRGTTMIFDPKKVRSVTTGLQVAAEMNPDIANAFVKRFGERLVESNGKVVEIPVNTPSLPPLNIEVDFNALPDFSFSEENEKFNGVADFTSRSEFKKIVKEGGIKAGWEHLHNLADQMTNYEPISEVQGLKDQLDTYIKNPKLIQSDLRKVDIDTIGIEYGIVPGTLEDATERKLFAIHRTLEARNKSLNKDRNILYKNIGIQLLQIDQFALNNGIKDITSNTKLNIEAPDLLEGNSVVIKAKSVIRLAQKLFPDFRTRGTVGDMDVHIYLGQKLQEQAARVRYKLNEARTAALDAKNRAFNTLHKYKERTESDNTTEDMAKIHSKVFDVIETGFIPGGDFEGVEIEEKNNQVYYSYEGITSTNAADFISKAFPELDSYAAAILESAIHYRTMYKLYIPNIMSNTVNHIEKIYYELLARGDRYRSTAVGKILNRYKSAYSAMINFQVVKGKDYAPHIYRTEDWAVKEKNARFGEIYDELILRRSAEQKRENMGQNPVYPEYLDATDQELAEMASLQSSQEIEKILYNEAAGPLFNPNWMLRKEDYGGHIKTDEAVHKHYVDNLGNNLESDLNAVYWLMYQSKAVAAGENSYVIKTMNRWYANQSRSPYIQARISKIKNLNKGDEIMFFTKITRKNKYGFMSKDEAMMSGKFIKSENGEITIEAGDKLLTVPEDSLFGRDIDGSIVPGQVSQYKHKGMFEEWNRQLGIRKKELSEGNWFDKTKYYGAKTFVGSFKLFDRYISANLLSIIAGFGPAIRNLTGGKIKTIVYHPIKSINKIKTASEMIARAKTNTNPNDVETKKISDALQEMSITQSGIMIQLLHSQDFRIDPSGLSINPNKFREIRDLAKAWVDKSGYTKYVKKVRDLQDRIAIADKLDPILAKNLKDELIALEEEQKETKGMNSILGLTSDEARKKLLKYTTDKFWDFGFKAFNKPEEYLRPMAFMLGYLEAKDLGYNVEDSIEYGKIKVANTQSLYASKDKQLGATKQLGSLLLRYAQYPVTSLKTFRKLVFGAADQFRTYGIKSMLDKSPFVYQPTYMDEGEDKELLKKDIPIQYDYGKPLVKYLLFNMFMYEIGNKYSYWVSSTMVDPATDMIMSFVNTVIGMLGGGDEPDLNKLDTQLELSAMAPWIGYGGKQVFQYLTMDEVAPLYNTGGSKNIIKAVDFATGESKKLDVLKMAFGVSNPYNMDKKKSIIPIYNELKRLSE